MYCVGSLKMKIKEKQLLFLFRQYSETARIALLTTARRYLSTGEAQKETRQDDQTKN